MKNFALIGHSIQHSLSPELAHMLHFEKITYDLIDSEQCQSFHKLLDEYEGFNVTSPFKEQASLQVDQLEGRARFTKACNWISRTPEKKIIGHHTDGDGLIFALQDVAFDEAYILGFGACGRSAQQVMENSHHCHMFSRTGHNSWDYWEDRIRDKKNSLIISTLPPEAPFLQIFAPVQHSTIIDFNYGARHQNLRQVIHPSNIIIDGLKILFGQALESWNLWDPHHKKRRLYEAQNLWKQFAKKHAS